MPKKSALSAKQLQKDARTYIWHPFTQMQEWEQQSPLLISRGKGTLVYDVDGNAYLDGTSSIWVNLHGHRHPTIDQAIRKQLTRIAHTTLLGLSHPLAIQLAKALVAIAPPARKSLFFRQRIDGCRDCPQDGDPILAAMSFPATPKNPVHSSWLGLSW